MLPLWEQARQTQRPVAVEPKPCLRNRLGREPRVEHQGRDPQPEVDEFKLTNERIARIDAFPPPPSSDS